MKTTSKKALSTLLALALVFSLFIAMPITASADSAVKIADMINDYAYFGSGALSAEVSGNTVTVTGSATSGGRIINLNFDPGVTVIWKADYSSSEINAININGEGVFELPQGGSLTLTGSGSAITVGNSAIMNVIVSGGEIHSEGGCIGFGTKGAIVNISGGVLDAKKVALSGQQGKIHVSGGLVTSSEGTVISNIGDGSSITISGGTVRSVDSVAITSGGAGSIITISGGLVENGGQAGTAGASQTISAANFTMTGGVLRNLDATSSPGQSGSASVITFNGDFDISGGQISSRVGYVLYPNGVNYSINVRGGFMFSYGTNITRLSLSTSGARDNVINSTINDPVIGGEAVLCAWNQAVGRTTYTAGKSDDLVVAPTGASAVWGKEGGESGIKYSNGSNTGFFPLDGVTVTGEDDATPPPETQPPGDSSLPNNMSNWAKQEVEKAYEMGLIPDSLLDPGLDYKEPITRAEFAALSVKVYESLSGLIATPAANNPFTDTNDVEVLKAYQVGITTGMSETTFAPGSLLNREQAATMLTRVFKKINFDGWTIQTDGQFALTYEKPAPFADDAQISDWAKDSVYFMYANGIIQGTGNNMFAPRAVTSSQEAIGYATATREQAIAIAVRMAENLGS